MGIDAAVLGGILALASVIGIALRVVFGIQDKMKEEVKPLHEKIKTVEVELIAFKLDVSRTYTTKEDVMNANKPVLDSVERLTHSVDRMGTRIDRVIEQSNAVKPATRRRPVE